MTVPFVAPAWLPSWLELLLLALAALFVLAFLLMPFSVFGLKGRLDGLEARLDEIQGEIRSLSLRLPEPRVAGYEDPAREVGAEEALYRTRAAPPIPPARAPARDSRLVPPARPASSRAEPRLDWPR